MDTIKTKNFILRPLSIDDVGAIVKKLDDPVFSRNTATIPYPYSRKDSKAWVKKMLVKLAEKPIKKVHFMIEVNGELAGAISLDSVVHGHKAEMGYWLARDFWGQGIMTEAAKKVANYGFKKLKLKRICATVYSYNPGSMKVLQKAGFVLEGVEKKGAKKGNRYIDVHVFALVK